MEPGHRDAEYTPPTPPVLKKLGRLDQELRDILEDPSLGEMEKIERYETTLMKWGKFYRQYQSGESSGRDNTSFNNTTDTTTSPAAAVTPSTWHSTPKTTVSTPDRSRYRSRAPRRPSPPLSLPFDAEDFSTPPTSNRKKKKKNKPLTPVQAVYNLRDRGRNQVESSWLSWRLNTPKRRRR